MTIYRDGQQDIGVTLGQLNVDNLAVTLEGVSVLSFLYGYDSVGANWDRLATSAAGLLVDTELPAAALLADNAATPTAPAVGAFGMVFDGATWDFMRGTAVDGVLVNLGANNDVDTELPAAALLADATANPTVPGVGAFLHGWNGATWDRVPGTATGIVVQGSVADGGNIAGTRSFPIGAIDTGNLLRFLSGNNPADGLADDISLHVISQGAMWNGATWDRERNNHEITALASGARVATTTSASLTNYNAKGITIQLDVTAVGAPAGTVTLIEVLTLVGTTEVVLYTFDIVDLGAVGTRHLLIYPGAASAGNWSLAPVEGVIPRTFRIRVTHADANSITYSVVCSMIN